MNRSTLERRPYGTRRTPTELGPTAQYAFSRVLPLIGRLMLSSLFLVSALRIMTDWGAAIGYASAEGFSHPAAWTGVTLAINLVFGLCVAAGFYTRASALVLAAYFAVLTFAGHAFWTYTGADYAMHLNHFMKNIAIIGGLLVVGSYGPGRVGMDRSVVTEDDDIVRPAGRIETRDIYSDKEI